MNKQHTPERFSYAEIAAALRLENGVLVWRVTRGGVRIGQPAGRLDAQGYAVLQFRRHVLQAHRVVWLLSRGEWPAGLLDHINGERADNRPENLRLATHAQNQQNRRGIGAVPFKGVVTTPDGTFQVTCAGKYVGKYGTAEAAARAYDAVARQRFGEFARLNFGS